MFLLVHWLYHNVLGNGLELLMAMVLSCWLLVLVCAVIVFLVMRGAVAVLDGALIVP